MKLGQVHREDGGIFPRYDLLFLSETANVPLVYFICTLVRSKDQGDIFEDTIYIIEFENVWKKKWPLLV